MKNVFTWLKYNWSNLFIGFMCAWMFVSWLDIITHNTSTYVYASWNLWLLIFSHHL